ncbi:response regulator [Patescibacteria group bacterium]|nr:response regulator [Patescibacteria group bacterium]
MQKDIKVLLADDSAFMRKILRDILEHEGYSHFIECADGEECIEKSNSENPDLIFLDIVMPKIDGIEVLKRVGRNYNVIVVSAIGQEKTKEMAKDLGAKGYITKPFDWKQVSSEIKKLYPES